MFHCNTCDTDWPPSHDDIAKFRRQFFKDFQLGVPGSMFPRQRPVRRAPKTRREGCNWEEMAVISVAVAGDQAEKPAEKGEELILKESRGCHRKWEHPPVPVVLRSGMIYGVIVWDVGQLRLEALGCIEHYPKAPQRCVLFWRCMVRIYGQ